MNKDAADVLKHLADKLDVPVEQLWSGLIAYAPFTYYQWLAMTVGAAIATVVLIGVVVYCIKQNKEMPWGPIGMISGIGVVIFACHFAFEGIGGMADALAAKHAPQAWAAKHIINKLGR
jgi:hypothetical protein